MATPENDFPDNILMPEKEFIKIWERYTKEYFFYEKCCHVSDDFGISFSRILKRAHDLNLLNF